ncbi:peptidyl-prolyl cis-trans isomerase CYP28, chloroplastic [Prosopis cineraria]|uniref:peptidyl-prolyl cis-trans isomerase CYP28, chloroplastic n=1 Tax=Prosopis cineraria TaxID=364024 RepID=UPI00240F325C|nr:peptidyl-prolyl cis-trans isomerase CYP28, chloroplastic [Prosopis cineraria]
MGFSVTPPSLLSPLRHHNHHHPSLRTSQPSYPKPNSKILFNRRSLLLLSTSLSIPSAPLFPSFAAADTAKPPPDTTVTDRVFMDFSLCPNYFLPTRTLGDNISSLCSESIPLGRIVVGLYGHLVPVTVSNFKSMCVGSSGSSYKNTLVHKIFPGQYFLAGRQGRREKGEVQPPVELARNTETVESKAFSLAHSKAGVLSLPLSENDDEDEVKLDPNYRNVEFLITTGPGPCPQLDSKNIVFGTVLEGLDVITAIAAIPTYQPSERIRQFNDLAGFFGDERAQNARASWNRPLKTVYISDCGELQVAKPSLSPSLP